MVTEFYRPKDASEALALLEARGAALVLAGGTQILSSEFQGRSFEVVAMSGILSSTIRRDGEILEIGAGATFQALADSIAVPAQLRAAARGMVDRNIRNRATLGGNLGADKSCSSLIPLLLALDAELTLLDGRKIGIEAWLALASGPRGRSVISQVLLSMKTDVHAGYARWTRVSCDLSILVAAASFRLESGLVRAPRIALGGMAAHSRRFPNIETLFEGRPLPSREIIEIAVTPYLMPLGDARASADFKRLRCAGLIAEALLEARPLAEEATR